MTDYIVPDARLGPGLGKVFISYSHKDSQFVNKLDRKLQQHGFDTWRYEKDILVGDSIPEKIVEAIDRTRVIVIVVSPDSHGRPWLRYELTKATERMINGGCRVMPVLIGNIDPPAMIGHMHYADCRKGSRRGYTKILQTLQFESSRYPIEVPPSLDSPDPLSRGQAIEGIARTVFDGHGYASMDLSATRSLDWEILSVYRPPDLDFHVLYEDVLDHGNIGKPFELYDWNEFKKHSWEACYERYALLVSHLPIDKTLAESLYRLPSEGVHYSVCEDEESGDPPNIAVLFDVRNKSAEDIKLGFQNIKALFIREAETAKAISDD